MKIRHTYSWPSCQHLKKLIGLINQCLFIEHNCSSFYILVTSFKFLKLCQNKFGLFLSIFMSFCNRNYAKWSDMVKIIFPDIKPSSILFEKIYIINECFWVCCNSCWGCDVREKKNCVSWV